MTEYYIPKEVLTVEGYFEETKIGELLRYNDSQKDIDIVLIVVREDGYRGYIGFQVCEVITT